jgi:hypothetical protein
VKQIHLIILLFISLSGFPAYAEDLELKCKSQGMRDYFTFLIDTTSKTVKDDFGFFKVKYFSPTLLTFQRQHQYKTHSTTRLYEINRVNLDFKYIWTYDCYYSNKGNECDTKVGLGKCYINNPETIF